MVQLCNRKRDDALVIIKEIPVEEMTVVERQAALNEVKVLDMLNHPNITMYVEATCGPPDLTPTSLPRARSKRTRRNKSTGPRVYWLACVFGLSFVPRLPRVSVCNSRLDKASRFPFFPFSFPPTKVY